MKKRFVSKVTAILLAMACVLANLVINPTPAEAGVSLLWPVPGFEINLKNTTFHENSAIDIAAAGIGGAKIVAALGGTVQKVFNCTIKHAGVSTGCANKCDGVGTGVIIKGTDGRIYSYAHMKAGSIPSNIVKGATVSQGQVIGAVGTTGNSTGNHLHFGITYNTYYDFSGKINPQNETWIYALNQLPKGAFDACTATNNGIRIQGWAFDPDEMGKNLWLHVYVGGPAEDPTAETFFNIKADTLRTDVGSAFGCGDYHGFDTEIVTTKKGRQPVYVYAMDTQDGTNPFLGTFTVDIPEIFICDPVVKNVTSNGYDVSCTIKSVNGISKVQCPTWTHANDQDDLQVNWQNSPAASATISGNKATFHVDIRDHNNETGWYHTHVYAYDNAGFWSKINCTIYVGSEEFGPDTEVLDRTYFNGHEYLLVQTNMICNWTEALTIAQSWGASLACITSKEENDAIATMVGRTINEVDGPYIGATDYAHEGTWTWVSGEPMVYTNWNVGQPDNYDGIEHYAMMYQVGTWNDYHANYRPKTLLIERPAAEYTISFDVNGGSISESASYKVHASSGEYNDVSWLNPTMNGSTFEGWYTDPKGGTMVYDANGIAVGDGTYFDNMLWVGKADATFYAHWSAPEFPFTDVKLGGWQETAVRYVLENAIMSGRNETTFDPNTAMTRAQLVTVLWNIEGQPKLTGTMPFSDVSSKSVYYKAILWGSQNKIINGYATGEFKPSEPLTRQQIAAILMNYAKFKGITIKNTVDISSYKDVALVSKSMTTAMKWAVGNKIISGKSNGTMLDPKGQATRVEVAAMVMNYCKKFR